MINWLKYTKIYFSISLVLILFSAFSIFKYGFNLGVDFTGGANVEYRLEKDIDTNNLQKEIESREIEVVSIQKTQNGTVLIRTSPLGASTQSDLDEAVKNMAGEATERIRLETVGPSIGPELVKKTMYAVILAAVLILFWIAYQFRNINFGLSAVLAMFHDTFILIGVYSFFGKVTTAEVDYLFVTAVLTILSFSVHDTIVVFDRIREIKRRYGGEIQDIGNSALTETMVRSLNNSFTIIFMLLALILLGGETVRWFAAALLVGTVMGTYSSPFVAVPLLVNFQKVQVPDLKKLRERKIK